MTRVIELAKYRQKVANDSIDEAIELIDRILELKQGQLMMITNMDGELRCEVVEAHWFKTE